MTEEAAALAAGRAIDLGTGEGRNAIWLAERGWQVTAVDFSAAGLARAGRLATRGHGGPQDPGRLYAPATVDAELDGLAIRRAEQVLRPVHAPDGERTAIDTLVRAERPWPPAAR